MRNLYTIFLLFISLGGYCQQPGVLIGANPGSPDPSAMLDVSSTSSGMLPPRMTISQMNAISSPANGLIVFTTDCNVLYINSGTPSAKNWIPIYNNITAAVSITASPVGGVCAGTSVTFTATPVNGGSGPAYQWTVNGSVVGTNSATYSYVPKAGDAVACTMTSNEACATGSPATSNTITEIVNALPAVTVVPPTTSACSGISTTLTASGGNTYSWSTSASTAAIIVNPTASTGYRVTATNTATGCTDTASASVTVKPYYVPITLTNNTSSSTPANFQQMITVNSVTYSSYENSGLQNIEFSTGSAGTGTVLQAWIESGASSTSGSTVYWVNLGSNLISANSNLTIYMNFMPSSVISGSGPTGEAPQLSSSYGQYDNGASVFTNYWNFAGTSTPTGWTVNDGATVVINNGITISGITTGAAWNRGGLGYNTAMPSSYIAEACLDEISGSNNGNLAIFPNVPSGITTSSTYTTIYVEENYDGWSWQPSSGSMTFNGSYKSEVINSYAIYSYYVTGNTCYEQTNYGSTTPTATGYTSTTYIGFGDYTDTQHAYWARTRAPLPGGTMPGVTFGTGSCQ